MKNRKTFPWLTVVLIWVGIVVMGGSTLQGQSIADHPNVLLIIVDDLRCELGCYGAAHIQSPNIDRLADEGLRFERAFVQMQFCGPSRASFLTGLRPDRTGIQDNRPFSVKRLPPGTVTLPHLFHRFGYFTGSYGKVFHGWSSTEAPPTWDVIGNGRATPLGRRGEGRNLTGGAVKWCEWRAAEGDDEDQPDGQIAQGAIRFLRERPADKPFFLAVGFHKPHDPFIAPKKYFDIYPIEKIELNRTPGNADAPNPGAVGGAWKGAFDKFTDRERLEFLRAYYACITFTDRQVGKVLDELGRLKLRDETVILFISDHGYHLGEHGWWNKNTLYEYSTRTPLIVSVPRMKTAGRQCRSIVELVDLYPTLADLGGLKAPGNLDGRSFRRLLDNPAMTFKAAAYSQQARGGRALRTDRWRYVEWESGEPPVELYDHQIDPGEFHNVAHEPEHAELIRQLRTELRLGQRP